MTETTTTDETPAFQVEIDWTVQDGARHAPIGNRVALTLDNGQRLELTATGDGVTVRASTGRDYRLSVMPVVSNVLEITVGRRTTA